MSQSSFPSPSEFPLGLTPGEPLFPAVTDFSKLTVLIVDDEPMLRSVIQDFLLMLGFENQRVAGDGIEALEVMRAEPIDFMLSDIRMPKMELEELLGVVKQEFPRLIVVATSGFSDLESARNIFMKGAHDFIGKPLNLDALELAIQWIVERQRVLQVAEQFFGQAALPVEPETAEGRLAGLKEMLRSGTHHFEGKILHSIRMAEFIRTIQTGLELPELVDLQVAALLHELGTGYQIQSLCRQARPLDDDERRLVQEHARISGRLVSWSLERPEFQKIIGSHLEWQALMVRPAASWTTQERQAMWLGVANVLDGFLHDRPDRPAATAAKVREIFARRLKHAGASPAHLLLEQWEQVEAFFGQHVG
jgi:response regulator RpfG family c-di-GMP phosphodiesterase